ncbi:integrase [Colwellia sp. PAMC 20917]|uniref:tyrosine-type recombinase/integrase n=1 Tax=Colwellia sp. PAMC 20917 TaxID=1816218 RepID=UPI000878F703|nr:tyrosine-type recombinase/integrase [Colwellia sp. PAMC 20917]AOW77216.1 integrase [Colwellia sp. PAMC 20917]AOW78377.1 integrase [Colwellia sp. PAMC 20917]
MIHGQAELTEREFEQQRATVPVKDGIALKRAQKGSLTGIATFIKLDNGNYHVLSRYENDIWQYPASEFPSGKKKSEEALNFTRITNESIRAMVKWIIWNKRNEGNSIGSLQNNLYSLISFFAWIDKTDTLSVQGLNAFTAQAYVAHVNTLTIKRKGKVSPVSKTTKLNKFVALEQLYLYCNSFDFVKEQPWFESSASEQAGHVGPALKDNRSKPKTLLIPDNVLLPLCGFTKDFLDRANEILDLRDKLDGFTPTRIFTSNQVTTKRTYLLSLSTSFDKLNDFNNALLLLRDSCLFWILLTTGMRIHEVLGIKRGAYRTETKDGETYYYIETVSKKTYTGLAEWIAPKIAVDAIKILERSSSTLQALLEVELAQAKTNSDHAEVNRLTDISGKVCISYSKTNSTVSVLSSKAVTSKRLPNLCKQVNADWDLSSHQFRRTFANYVAHSELGDLRALKYHFKHWSITMTALYAYNDALDLELFEEMLKEKYWVEEQIKFDWFDLDSPITGGAIAERIMQVRGDEERIKTFKTKRDMIKAYSGNIPIRSTGIAWCTNDDDGCMGGKCEECESGIVDKNNQKHWEGMLIQQFELSKVDDIGEAGQASVAKGMVRCEKVLTSLGVDVETMKDDIRNNNHAA